MTPITATHLSYPEGYEGKFRTCPIFEPSFTLIQRFTALPQCLWDTRPCTDAAGLPRRGRHPRNLPRQLSERVTRTGHLVSGSSGARRAGSDRLRRVLFDEDMPRQLRRDLPDFEIRTVQEEGWSSIQNGELLRRAAMTFDVMVTADQRLQYQQNISQFEIGVVVVMAPDTRLPHLRTLVPQLRIAINKVVARTIIIVKTA